MSKNPKLRDILSVHSNNFVPDSNWTRLEFETVAKALERIPSDTLRNLTQKNKIFLSQKSELVTDEEFATLLLSHVSKDELFNQLSPWINQTL